MTSCALHALAGVQEEDREAPRCAYCGSSVAGGGLCFSHVNPDHDWAASNRAVCDFVHRGLIREGPLGEEPLV